jgi:hypothetical protein
MMKSLLLFLFAIEIKAKIVAKYFSVTLAQFISFAYLCIKVKILNISKLQKQSEAIKTCSKMYLATWNTTFVMLQWRIPRNP